MEIKFSHLENFCASLTRTGRRAGDSTCAYCNRARLRALVEICVRAVRPCARRCESCVCVALAWRGCGAGPCVWLACLVWCWAGGAAWCEGLGWWAGWPAWWVAGLVALGVLPVWGPEPGRWPVCAAAHAYAHTHTRTNAQTPAECLFPGRPAGWPGVWWRGWAWAGVLRPMAPPAA